MMKALVAAGADPELRAQDGTTVLMAAASARSCATVKYAYEIDPNVDVVRSIAADTDHARRRSAWRRQRTQDEVVEVIQFLADKGAKLDEIDAAGARAITHGRRSADATRRSIC